MAPMDRFRAGRSWFRRRFGKTDAPEDRGRTLVIGSPTNFRREQIMLAKDAHGNDVIIASPVDSLPPNLRDLSVSSAST